MVLTLEPDRAIVPKLAINSSLVIPTPVSWIVKVRFCLSVPICISKLLSPATCVTSLSLRHRYLNFSSASLAFETSSRTNT